MWLRTINQGRRAASPPDERRPLPDAGRGGDALHGLKSDSFLGNACGNPLRSHLKEASLPDSQDNLAPRMAALDQFVCLADFLQWENL